jgi:peroxisomal 2,4-dienoyl-CoA reductase
VSTFGSLSILINNAAGNFLCPARLLTPNGFKSVYETDALGTFNMCISSFPHLSSSPFGKGRIVNISSNLQSPCTPYQAHAAAAKAAVDSLTRSFAMEWGKHNIRVNGVAPGPIDDTEGMRRLGPAAEAVGDLVGER